MVSNAKNFMLRNPQSSMQKRLESRQRKKKCVTMSGRALKMSLFDDFQTKTNKYKRLSMNDVL